MMTLLKALWKLRPPGEPEPPSARLVRRWREKRLLARLEYDWPGGFTLHRTGDLVYVPTPLDARGRHALLHPPRAHPGVLGFLHPGAVVIDIGANLGEWTLPFARAVGPGGRVIAIEPAPTNATGLEATLAANALHQAEVFRCAIGDRDGHVDFAVPIVTSAQTDTGTARIGPAPCGHQALQVPLRSLDSVTAERRLDRLDLIKVDVEGYERQVIIGAAALLDRFRPVLVIETGHEREGDREVIHEHLCGLGYRVVGIPLDYGMARADWQSYVQVRPPFRAGDAHNLLLVPERRYSAE